MNVKDSKYRFMLAMQFLSTSDLCTTQWNWWEGQVCEMVEEVYDESRHVLDLAIVDAVEMNGSLRSALFDDLQALR